MIKRILTALILIPITIALLFYLPPAAFCFLVSFITLGAAWEWTNLMQIEKNVIRLLYLVLMTVLFLGGLFIPVPFVVAISFVWWVVAIGLIMLYPRASAWWQNQVMRGIMGIFVLLPCWMAVNYIRNANQGSGIYALLYLFVLIWGADSAAYFAGKKWGKHRLALQVSPGKTIEGVIGALICSLIITIIALWLSEAPREIWGWGILLSLITVCFSVVGDLFESMLKRAAGLKDSGHLLPGHGGLLDRIDSLTAAAPVFTLGAMMLSIYLG